MPVKTKPARRRPARRPARQPPTAHRLFGERVGILKAFANYGAAGLFGGYLLIFTLPEAQKSFTTAIEKQAEQNREDRRSAIAHGERAVERIAGSIDGLRGSFGSVQSVTQGNQKELIRLQSRTNELLETKPGSKSEDSPALPAVK